MEQTINDEILEKLNQLQIDITIIKEKLNDENEILTDWAKEELEKARNEPQEKCTSIGDLRKEIENDL